MKNLTLAALLFALLFTGCKDEIDYPELIVGKWMLVLVNGEPVLTDNMEICEYRADGIELYSSGFQLDQTNKTWLDRYPYTYSIDGNTITIEGTDSLDRLYHSVFEIKSIDNNTVTYTVLNYSLNGVEFMDTNVYTYRRVTTDYMEQLIGLWYGRYTTPVTTDSTYYYWEYLPSGMYNYYYQNDAMEWHKKTDVESTYFLYGTCLASAYTSGLEPGVGNKVYECWDIALDGDTMTWTGLRANNFTETYEMVKVSNPPAVVN